MISKTIAAIGVIIALVLLGIHELFNSYAKYCDNEELPDFSDVMTKTILANTSKVEASIKQHNEIYKRIKND